MRIVLVNMPWASANKPSLALGILREATTRKLPDAEVTVVYGNLEYVDWLVARGQFGFYDYDYYSDESYFHGCGDWIFSAALYSDPGWRVNEFEKHMGERADAERIAQAAALHRTALDFIGSLAGQIISLEPDVVGFTTTFQQNTAALAAAREIKRLSPGIVTVFGGANCDGAQGEAVHRNFPFVDFVVRGEGDVSFPALLEHVGDVQEHAAIPGLCWRRPDGATVANPMARSPLPPSAMVVPAFDEFFERFAASAAGAWVEPRLVVESARGCWWGEKHHCTFCGLNGSFMQFRSKSPDTFVAELLALVERHKILDVAVVDNILDMSYLNSALPAITEAGYDLRLYYEIKANMKRDQLKILRAAGVVHVQPGIENLNSKILKLMDKGVTGCQNVRLLRDAESLGMQISWNYLFGFPAEEEEDYRQLIEQFPALHHLMPPESAGPIMIERFSPYFNRPELGFDNISAASSYRVIYDLPERELHNLCYYFDSERRGIGEEVMRRLREAVGRWTRAYYDKSRLTYSNVGEEIILVNTRPGFDWHAHLIGDPVEIAAFRLLDQPHAAGALSRKLAAAGHGITGEELAGILLRWQALGIVFTENEQYIQLATDATNQELQRWVPARATADRRIIGAGQRRSKAMPPQPAAGHSISAWGDYDETAVALRDGVSLGSWALTARSRISADDLFAAGARQVTFHEAIDTDSADADSTVRALTLIRDLTACGIVVDWNLRAGADLGDWRALSHLYPPASLTFDGVARDDGNADPQAEWAGGYVMTKCAARRGPGLLQIRDRRWGGLRNITIAGPDYLAAIAKLEPGVPADQVPAKILGELSAQRLVGLAGDVAWWLPYQVRRWPVSPRSL